MCTLSSLPLCDLQSHAYCKERRILFHLNLSEKSKFQTGCLNKNGLPTEEKHNAFGLSDPFKCSSKVKSLSYYGFVSNLWGLKFNFKQMKYIKIDNLLVP